MFPTFCRLADAPCALNLSPAGTRRRDPTAAEPETDPETLLINVKLL